MIVEQSTGATSRETVDWHSIDWKKAHKIVNRLQARIVQATKAGKRNKVKALQRILTHSFSGKALAVKRVTENQGKNTPGVDKILWNTPEKKAMAVQELQSRGYTAQPLRRMYLPKPNGKQRPLGIPTMKDRGMQALYLQALDPIAETQADTHSYGFRKERSCADAITQCYRVLFREDMLTWILEGDQMVYRRRHQRLFRFCMLMPPSRTREARQCMPGEKHGLQLAWSGPPACAHLMLPS